jgi:hypothetical protein
MLHTIHECCFNLALLDPVYQKIVSEVMFQNTHKYNEANIIVWYIDTQIQISINRTKIML